MNASIVNFSALVRLPPDNREYAVFSWSKMLRRLLKLVTLVIAVYYFLEITVIFFVYVTKIWYKKLNATKNIFT